MLNQLTPRESYVLSGYRAEVLRNLSLYGEIELSIRVQNEFPRYVRPADLKRTEMRLRDKLAVATAEEILNLFPFIIH